MTNRAEDWFYKHPVANYGAFVACWCTCCWLIDRGFGLAPNRNAYLLGFVIGPGVVWIGRRAFHSRRRWAP